MTAGTAVPSIQFTEVGFIAPSGPAVLAGVQTDISAAFGSVLSYNLNTPQGQLASSNGAVIANANAEFVYLSQQLDPAYASGRWQDAIARIYYLTRNPAEPTVLQVTCLGLAGVNILAGTSPSQVQDAAGNYYACTEAGEIPVGGSITLSFACTVPGPVPVPASNGITIVNGISGWDSASVASGDVGENDESRSAFETRRQDSVAGNSFGAIGSIIGAIAQVPGVLDYYGYNNNTSGSVTVGGVTIAAYSIYLCVAGGSPSAVAQAILTKKGAGAPMVGNTTVTAYDSNPLYATPQPYAITWETPSPLQILYKVTIVNGPQVPSNATAQVQNALLAAFAGSSLPASFTGSVAGTTLTVTAIESGALGVGQVLSDVSGNLLAGTQIVGLGTGTGGVGNYQVSTTQTVASEPMTAVSNNAVTVPKARINSTLYNLQYVAPINALGVWAQVAQLGIGSANTPDAVIVGSIAGTTLTVTSTTSGSVIIGQYLTDPLGLIINGTQVVSGSGSTWTVNNTQTVAGATFTGTGTGTSLAVTAVTGSIGIGDVISGTGVPGGTTILAQVSGTPGGAGTYTTSASTTATAAAITANSVISLSTADQTDVVVQANQIPQLVAANIQVTLT